MTGFRKRKGKLSPFDFVVLMAFGQLGMKHPSLAGMVAGIKIKLSRVAMHYRFSKSAADFLWKCLTFVIQQKIHSHEAINTKLLSGFRRVLLVDSSSWDVNEKLRETLPGSGGSASAANCKLQTAYDYKSGQLEFLDVTAGTVPDNRYTDHLPGILNKNDLLLVDLGYFKIKTLAEIQKKEAFFLTRFLVHTNVYQGSTETPLNLKNYLNTLCDNECELDVTLGSENGDQVHCRLVAFRATKQVANGRRRRLRKDAKKKGRSVSRYHLNMCNWTLFVTNISKKRLPLKMIRAFYTVRWQIELLFKQLKTVLCIHHSNTTNEFRLRCELYGKLIGAVLIHRLHANETNKMWNTKRREISMEKFYKRMQERAFMLFQKLLSSVEEAAVLLRDMVKDLIHECLKGVQPSRLNTLEILEAQCDPVLESRKKR